MLMTFQYYNLMQFYSLTFQQMILIDGFTRLGTVMSLISVGVDAIIVLVLNFETRCSISAFSPV